MRDVLTSYCTVAFPRRHPVAVVGLAGETPNSLNAGAAYRVRDKRSRRRSLGRRDRASGLVRTVFNRCRARRLVVPLKRKPVRQRIRVPVLLRFSAGRLKPLVANAPNCWDASVSKCLPRRPDPCRPWPPGEEISRARPAVSLSPSAASALAYPQRLVRGLRTPNARRRPANECRA